MDAPYSSTDKFPRVPLKIAGAKPLQFSHNMKLMVPAILPEVFLLVPNSAILLNMFLLLPNPAILVGVSAGAQSSCFS